MEGWGWVNDGQRLLEAIGIRRVRARFGNAAFEAIAGASQGAIEAVQKQEQSARRLLRLLASF